MALSVSEPSAASVGNFLLIWVPGPTKPTIITATATTSKDLTYSMAGGGFAPTTNANTVTDARVTRKVNPTQIASSDTSLTTEYVAGGATTDVARISLAEGTEGWFVSRPFIPNETALSTTQVVNLYHVRTGPQPAPVITGDIQTIVQQHSILEPPATYTNLAAS